MTLSFFPSALSAFLFRGFLAPLLFLCFLVSPVCAAEPGGRLISIVDDSGATVTLEAPAKRIIPLYAALAEILVDMGLQDRLIARTASDTDATPNLPSVGTHMRPNPELIAGLQPDLVVLMEGRDEAAATAALLSNMGIPVARFRVDSFTSLFSCITRLSVLTGTESEAQTLISGYSRRLEAVGAAAASLPSRPSIFFEVRYPNLLGAGQGSILTDIISAAGGENCLAAYPDKFIRLSEEALISLNPDIYIVQEGPMNKNPQPLADRPHFRSLTAVLQGNVLIVPESLFSRPGPSSIAAAERLGVFIREWAHKEEKHP